MKKLLILLLALVTSELSYSIGNLGGYDCFGGMFKTPFLRLLDLFFARSAITDSENSSQAKSFTISQIEIPLFNVEDFLGRASKTVLQLLKACRDKPSEERWDADLSVLNGIITAKNVTVVDAKGRSILFYIAQGIDKRIFFQNEINNLKKVIQFLVDLGIDVNAKDNKGNTVLHVCNDTEMVKLLLEKKANPDLLNFSGETPFYAAVCRGQLEIADFYLEHGADINQCRVHRVNLLFPVMEKYRSSDGRLPIMLDYLIKRGININEQTVTGMTPLHSALAVTASNNDYAAEYLIRRPGIKLNIKDCYGNTPLDYAKTNEYLYQLLRDRGAKHSSEL